VNQLDREVAVSAMVEAECARQRLDELLAAFGPLFARVEPFRAAGGYIRGLMSDLPRKNCWSLAQEAGDATPDRMQRLLERARWDALAAMKAVRDFVVEHLAAPGLTVAVVDESGQAKRGVHTAGVGRQYLGCLGRVTNAINFVTCTYSTARGHALIGSRLYIPAEQARDAERKAAVGIPADREFKTKPALAIELLADQLAAGVDLPWCAGDSVYGQDPKLRTFCQEHRIGYVLGISCSFPVVLPSGRKVRADATLKMITPRMWTITGQGRWAWAWLATADPEQHLLIRRSLTTPVDLDFFTCYVPENRPVTLGVLVAVAEIRWQVEEDHQAAKGQFGFDSAQVRHFGPIMRHLVLVMAALAVCAVTAAQARPRTNRLPPAPSSPNEAPPTDPGLIPLTVIEIKHLLNLLTHPGQTDAHRLHWIWWRRRHQARAWWFHQRARLRQPQATAA
jgi:SRSO17 transposase